MRNFAAPQFLYNLQKISSYIITLLELAIIGYRFIKRVEIFLFRWEKSRRFFRPTNIAIDSLLFRASQFVYRKGARLATISRSMMVLTILQVTLQIWAY